LAIPDFGPDRQEGQTDLNDMMVVFGPEAVKQAIANASEPTRGERHHGIDGTPEEEYLRDVSLLRACDVTPEPIDWLWRDWLAAGKFHVLGGAPGTGKTTLCMAMAATVSTGGRWPDGTRSAIGNTVIWSGEDDPSDTLIPRLILSGADLSRVYFITDVREDGERRSFDPARDMEPLRRKLLEIGDVRLLIVDPIVSTITGDSHKNAEVRRGLQPLADLSASIRCASVGITHFSKGTGGRDPVERLTGSVAFGALARIVMVAAKPREEGEDGRVARLFCRAKSNIGPDDGGFEYDLSQGELKTHPGIFSSFVLWGEPVEGAARELLATADATGDDGEGGSLSDAKRFLTDLLADGALPVKAIKGDVDGAGYSWATIRRAQKALGIEPIKSGFGKIGAWEWKLPVKDAKALNSEHLKQNTQGSRVEYLRPNSNIVEVEI
jgi:putative DNA primase/helicase